jgi:hypothetical protein
MVEKPVVGESHAHTRVLISLGLHTPYQTMQGHERGASR